MDAEMCLLHPIRSISLPSRLAPNSLHFQAQLNKLKPMHSITYSSRAETVQEGLVRLAEMYTSMAELIRSPHTQQALRQTLNASLIEEALESSIGLLDTCGSTRDLVSIMRQHVQDLQSVIRRRPGRDSSIETKVDAYICFKKKAKNDISKYLRALKKMESIINVDLDHRVMILEVFFGEVRSIAIATFRSLMAFLSETDVKKEGRWSLVKRLMPRVVDSIVNEMASVDCALKGVKKHDGDAKVDVQGRLERLDVILGGFEGALGCVFRGLIQNRVALLNMLTP